MQTLISFLRGVNMAGHNKIKMSGLAELYGKVGFRESETYIQSGNVIFTNEEDLPAEDITSKIEKAIQKKFKLDIAVMIRTPEEIKKIISINPFSGEENFDPAKMACLFMHETPSEGQISKIKDVHYHPDKFKIIGKEIFIYCPNGFGKTKLYTNFFEKKMGIAGTARNWKTINTILDIAEKK
jgi:uncharacterized protein (DUF1697 family)